MTPMQSRQPVAAPQPGVYTVLMIIAIVALLISIVLSGNRLMSAPGASLEEPGGYGVSVGEMFKPVDEIPDIQNARRNQ